MAGNSNATKTNSVLTAEPLRKLKRKIVRKLKFYHVVFNDKIESLTQRESMTKAHEAVNSAYVDSRIRFPSYVSLDEHIDVERLKSLSAYLNEKLKTNETGDAFWTGPYTADTLDGRRPGSTVIHLTQHKHKDEQTVDYFDLDKEELWEVAPIAKEYPEVMDFIKTLPFKSIGRILVIYDFNGKRVPAHRDHTNIDACHEFIWMRPTLKKPFYVMSTTGEREHFTSYSAWFDTVNQFHGGDAAEGMAISIRVDGVFSDELRKKIPVPDKNMASIPSLWATIGDQPAN